MTANNQPRLSKKVSYSVNRYTCLLVILLTSHFVSAQSDSVKRPKKVRYTPLPVIYYSPETKLGFGALVAANFSLAHDSLTTTSYAQTYFLYTVNNQYDWGNMVRLYAPQNKFIFQGKFSYTYFPEFYYGIETENPKPNEVTIEYTKFTTDFRFYWRVNKSIYAGFVTKFNSVDHISSDPLGSFYKDKPLGYTGYNALGIAPLLAIESRDNQNYPRTGEYVELQLLAYPKLGNSYADFFNVRLDARKYFPLELISDRDVLALQLFANINAGNVPFKDMADIGGGNVMRGYYTGFYRYKNLYALQAEFRAGLWRFIGIDAWIGGAFTPKNWYSIGDSGFKPNAGVGLRVMINQKDRLNIRVDQGFGNRKQQGFYLDIAEAY